MRNSIRFFVLATILVLAAQVLLSPSPLMAASKAEIDRDARAALEKLYKSNHMAQALAHSAATTTHPPRSLRSSLGKVLLYGIAFAVLAWSYRGADIRPWALIADSLRARGKNPQAQEALEKSKELSSY